MATLSNRIFERLQAILEMPLIVLGRVARLLPVNTLCSLEKVCCRTFGERIARLLDGTFFNLALLGRTVIRQMSGAELRLRIPFAMAYNAAEYTQRIAPLFGLEGPLATIPVCLDRNSVLFDIGANLGAVTVPAALRLRQARRVHAFEPNPRVRAQLLENLRLNGVEAVVNEVALSDRKGAAELHLDLGNSGAGSLIAGVDRGRKIHALERQKLEKVSVSTLPFDDYLRGLPPAERAEWGNVIVKVDVEGFEASVLAGGMGFLGSETRPVLLMVETMRFNIPQLPDLLRAKGFILVEECLPRLFRRLPSIPAGRIVDLVFLNNVRETEGGFFEWPVPR